MERRRAGRGGGLGGSPLLRCALAVVAAVVLFAGNPCEATTKPYVSRDDVPVIANNVSSCGLFFFRDAVVARPCALACVCFY